MVEITVAWLDDKKAIDYAWGDGIWAEGDSETLVRWISCSFPNKWQHPCILKDNNLHFPLTHASHILCEGNAPAAWLAN